ncbi:MAG: hypothetical protein V4617_15205 [Gemmatimonadota bacterium]
MKRPAYQFYPSDWRNDIALKSCSIGARGLWQELMNTMHFCTPYGHLVLNGAPMTDEESALHANVPVKEYQRHLAELERKGIFSRTDTGVIYSRRMVRDEELRRTRAKGGALALEHENVPQPKAPRKGPRRGHPEGPPQGPHQGIPSPGPYPPSLQGSPSSSSAVASASAFAGTAVTATPGPVNAADMSHCIVLTVAANQGLMAVWGDSVEPLKPQSGGTTACLQVLGAEGVDVEFARSAIFTHACALKATKQPPVSLKYFAQAAVDRWRNELSRVQAAGMPTPQRLANEERGSDSSDPFGASTDDVEAAMMARVAAGEFANG